MKIENLPTIIEKETTHYANYGSTSKTTSKSINIISSSIQEHALRVDGHRTDIML